jgi:hypothetical protein
MEELRGLAKEMLWVQLDVSKKIELATECNIEPWLLIVYTDFVQRVQSISVEEEEQLGWKRAANLFRVRHRRLQNPYSDTRADIRATFASEFNNIAPFDNSPISYLRPELHTAADPGIIQRDEVYYLVDIILSVNFFATFLMHVEAHPTHFRWRALYSSFPVAYLRSSRRYSRICFSFLPKAPHVMDLVKNNLFFFMVCARHPFDGCL